MNAILHQIIGCKTEIAYQLVNMFLKYFTVQDIHSPGHVIYVNFENNFAHLGDTLFRDSIGKTDILHGDYQQLMNSFNNKILPLGDEISFLCGHGPNSTIGRERRLNPFLKSNM